MRGKTNIQREALLRFWAAMHHLDYDEVIQAYLRQANNSPLTTSTKLYTNVEAAVHFMGTEPNPKED